MQEVNFFNNEVKTVVQNLSKSLRRERESGVRLLSAKAGNKTLFWEIGPVLLVEYGTVPVGQYLIHEYSVVFSRSTW
jgi:hypothetical protein